MAHCLITGKLLQSGDMQLSVGGKDYGVNANAWQRLTDEQRAALIAGLTPRTTEKAPPKKASE